MLIIGCHLSSASGFLSMRRQAEEIGANTFQFFLRNPRGGKAKAIDPTDADGLRFQLESGRLRAILAHAPYTLNPCAAAEQTAAFAREVLADDLLRMKRFPGQMYNLHPGSHVGQGVAAGVRKTAETLNAVLAAGADTTVLLETMAGQGSEIGSTFRELAQIIDLLDQPDRIGVCLDTCHVFCAGYDIRSDPDGVLTAFDREVGLRRLRYIHLNDSKFGCGSHRDRHEKLGFGELGWEAIGRLVRHDALRNLPFCLETPQETMAGYAEEIIRVKELAS